MFGKETETYNRNTKMCDKTYNSWKINQWIRLDKGSTYLFFFQSLNFYISFLCLQKFSSSTVFFFISLAWLTFNQFQHEILLYGFFFLNSFLDSSSRIHLLSCRSVSFFYVSFVLEVLYVFIPPYLRTN